MRLSDVNPEPQAGARTRPTGPDWVPSSCTLPTTEQPLRMAEFDALFEDHLLAVQRLGDTHARLILTGGGDVAEAARDLADRETACCSFFDLAVSEDAGAVRLDIRVPAAHADVLRALVARAEASAQRRTRP